MFNIENSAVIPPYAYPTTSKDIAVLRTLMDAPGGVLSITLAQQCKCRSLHSHIFRLRYLGWNILSIEQPPLLIDGEEVKRLVKYVLGSPYWNDPLHLDVDYQVTEQPQGSRVVAEGATTA